MGISKHLRTEQRDPAFNKETVLTIKNMTIPELAKRLESGEISSTLLDDKKILSCVAYWKSICYTDKMIGDFINKSDRQVRRLTKELRETNSLELTEDFQKDLIGQMLSQWQNQYSYFIRLANREDVSPLDRMRALYYTHQMQKDVIDTLGKYGYFSREQGIVDIKKEISKREEQLEDIHFLPDSALLDDVPEGEVADFHERVLEFIEDEAKKLQKKFNKSDDETNKKL